MHLSFLLLLILATMAGEIAGFVVVGQQIGALATVVFVFLTATVGLSLLRIQGFGVITRIQQEMDAGRVPGRELAHGVMIMLAGILLMIPGFLTDIVGFLLFLPPIRDLGWSLIRKRIVMVREFSWSSRHNAGGSSVIDLEADEYSRDGKGETPWRRIDRD